MKKLLLFCTSLGLYLFANNTKAAVTYWYPQGNWGSTATYTAGSLAGTWETASWSTSSTGQATPVAWIESTAACFGVGTGATNTADSTSTTTFTINVNANHTVAGFFNGALNPNSCIVTLSGPGILTIPTSLQGFDTINSSDGSLGQIVFNTVLAGPGSPTMEGFGQVFLNATNTYTGGTYLGYSGASFGGVVNFNSFGSFGTGSIVLSNSSGCALVAEGSSAITITNSVLVQQRGSLNLVGNPAGLTFTGPWTLNNVATLGSGGLGNFVTIAGPMSGAGGLTKGLNNGSLLTLSGTNTYTGPTTVTNGTLALASSGSISNTSLINIFAGSTLDVSAITNFALGPNTSLQANGGLAQAIFNGPLGGTINLGSQPVSLAYTPITFNGDLSQPALNINQSAVTFSGNQFSVTNTTGTPLDVGTYALLQVTDGASGTVTGTPNPNVVVSGASIAPGNSAALSVSGSTVVLVVAPATNLTTITLAPVTATNVYGSSTNFTATVSPDPSTSGGKVQFFVDGLPYGSPITVTNGGVVTSIATSPLLSATNHTISAQYSGSPDFVFGASASSVVPITITKAPLTITANNQTTTYGTAITLTGSTQFTSSGLKNGETVGTVTLTVSGGGANTEAAGTYTITPSAAAGGTFAIANYSVTYVPATVGLTVNKKALTITASAQSKAYGTTLTLGAGSTKFTSSGLVLSQTIGTVTITASGGTAAADPVGTYTLTPSAATGGTFVAANYTITYATGVLTVTKAGITVTANNQTKTYGQTVVFGPGSTLFTVTGMKNGETIGTVTLACAGGPANSPVSGSPYTITPSAATGGTFNAANYTITYATTGKLTVNVLPVILTGSRPYDGTSNAPAAILSVSNLVSGDVVTVGGGSATLADSSPGSQPITSVAALTLGGAAAGNYTLTGATGAVTISSASITISSNFLDATGTNFVLTFTSSPGVVYHVIGTNNIAAPQATWPTVAGPITATGTSTSVTNAINSPMEVFQVVSP